MSDVDWSKVEADLHEKLRSPRFTRAHALMLGGLAAVLAVTIWLIWSSLRS